MKINILKSNLALLFLLITYLAVGIGLFSSYFQEGLIKYLGLLIFPYVAIYQAHQPAKRIYALFAAFFLALSCLVYAQSIVFLAFMFALLFLLESIFGKLNYLPIFHIVILSNVFKHLTNIFTIPIRLELSTLASYMMNLIGLESKAYGNMIHLHQQVFSVDTACMGLNMLEISLVMTIFFLAHFERKYKIRLSFPIICIFLFLTFTLNIFSNLIRIITLVIFKVLPENLMHSVIGLLCFAIYVVLPSYFLVSKGIKLYLKRGNKQSEIKMTNFTAYLRNWSGNTMTSTSNTLNRWKLYFLVSMIVGIPICYKHTRTVISHQQSTKIEGIEVKGFKKEVVEDVIKFTKNNVLLYIKPIKSFFATEHNPMICWIGSGYLLKEIKKTKLQDKEIYVGVLVKDKNKIHTAWWYESNNQQTINQLEWRWDAMNSGKTYHLVNMNASDEAVLQQEVIAYWQNRQ